MKVIKFLIFPLFLILFSSSFISSSFASVESEAQEDIGAGCLDGEALVYRFTYADYVCVPQSTADKWVNYKMAEIIIESKQVQKEKSPQQLNPEFYGAPPTPPDKIRATIHDSECRSGQIQFYQFHYMATSCIEFSTATSWEKLGLGTIVKSEIEVESKEQNLEELDKVEQTKPISTKGISLPSYPNRLKFRKVLIDLYGKLTR